MTPANISFENVTCEFPGTRALNSINVTFFPGETHAVTGENGAGKSTLLKVLAGIVQPTSGFVHIGGETHRFIRHPWQLGIRIIPQEPLLAQHLSIAENVFLGRLPRRRNFRVDWPNCIAKAKALLDRVGLSHLDPRRPVTGLGLGEQQLIQVARALTGGGSTFLFDEPTSTLTSKETEKLFSVIRELTAEKATVLFVSHRIPEIFTICDRVTVLRDGNHIETRETRDVTPDHLIRTMVGRNLPTREPRDKASQQPVSLSLSGSIDLQVRRGEIVGLAGLVGAGRTELLEAVFGLRPFEGQIKLSGKAVKIQSTHDAVRAGLGHVPEDRKRDGLVLALNIEDNLALPNPAAVSRFGIILRSAKRKISQEWIVRLKVKCQGRLQIVRALSGGNQQKIVLAKWLVRLPLALLLDEPTRGVDVGAKSEIHALIRTLAGDGLAILLASSEMPELLELCDRILVMRGGKIVREFAGSQASEEEILRCAS